MDTTRRHLAELAALAHKTEAAERRILENAQAELERVQAKIKKLRGPAMVPGAPEADEYQQAVHDRGRLNVVIAQAQRILEHSAAS